MWDEMEGQVVMMMRAMVSSTLRLCAGLSEASTICCTLYSMVTFQVWDCPRSITIL
jgi:hypothetical protein